MEVIETNKDGRIVDELIYGLQSNDEDTKSCIPTLLASQGDQ